METPSPGGRTIAWVLLVALVVAGIGGGTWAWVNHQADQDRKERAVAAAAAKADAAGEKARAIQDEIETARNLAELFCAGDASLGVLNNADVAKRVASECPGIEKKATALAKAQRDRLRDVDDEQGSRSDSDFIGSDQYCFSRYDVVVTGNGPGSPYSDYPDEDIARSEAEFAAYCQDYEVPDH